MIESRYVTAKEAAAELDISLPTLYAYVSRGLIRSESTSDSKRSRRYRWEDVQKLKERQEVRYNPTKAAENALHWGMPILDSAITLIENGQLYYCGHKVEALALNHTVEQVAALIWTGNLESELFTGLLSGLSPAANALPAYLTELTPIEIFQVILPLIAVGDIAAYDLRPTPVAQVGARILRLLVASITGESQHNIASSLQSAWLPHDKSASPLLNAALILCADHELNVSAFTARCVASAGATPYNVVSAGLAALQGVKHGGNLDRVEAFIHEARSNPSAAIARRLKRGEPIPGFGHRLYPEGDPRARLLCNLLWMQYPESAYLRTMAEEVQKIIGELPNIDFALAALARTLELPTGGAIALFALGRVIGWIGHAIEQYQMDEMIRPRARYIGIQPE